MSRYVEKNVRLRFEEKYCPHPVTGCWNWLAAKSQDGYSYFYDGHKNMRGHQFSYLIYRGLIPDGMQIDHLCKNRGCVNPDHLESVTPKVNSERARGSWTHCSHGHPIDGYNVKTGKRVCTTCNRLRSAAWEKSGKRKPRGKS